MCQGQSLQINPHALRQQARSRVPVARRGGNVPLARLVMHRRQCGRAVIVEGDGDAVAEPSDHGDDVRAGGLH